MNTGTRTGHAQRNYYDTDEARIGAIRRIRIGSVRADKAAASATWRKPGCQLIAPMNKRC